MWRGLVAEALRGQVHVRCEMHDCLSGDSPCRVLIKLSS
jgi:hypothetical protein